MHRLTPLHTLSRLGAAALIAASALGMNPVCAAPAGSLGPLRSQSLGADGNVNSPNWSGYAVTSKQGDITQVSGSWIVPASDCSQTPSSGASHWIGIDGYTSRTVEQTGTDSDCAKGSPRYYAWYEIGRAHV